MLFDPYYWDSDPKFFFEFPFQQLRSGGSSQNSMLQSTDGKNSAVKQWRLMVAMLKVIKIAEFHLFSCIR